MELERYGLEWCWPEVDLAPGAVAEIAGERLPKRVARAYRRYRHGPGAFKVDLAVEGGVPWTNAAARKAGTVHAVGSFAEIVVAERETSQGRMPERPFVIVCRQSLADPTRARDGVHPVWAYAHVPHGSNHLAKAADVQLALGPTVE
jgi:phytoene dehydrogenase-like protein